MTDKPAPVDLRHMSFRFATLAGLADFMHDATEQELINGTEIAQQSGWLLVRLSTFPARPAVLVRDLTEKLALKHGGKRES